MNYKMVLKTIGKLLKVEAILLILPLIVSFIYNEGTFLSFLIPIALLALTGSLLSSLQPKRTNIFAREGLVIVGLSWIIMSLFGCLPFIISGFIPNFFDAFFETVSGLTTTGASIVTNIDNWYEGGKSLLFWRSFTHWIGGMGILVFVIAILPKSEGQNIYILRAESPGPQVGKLVSKIRLTARILYLIYLGLTITMMIVLAFDPKMPIFDAVVHSLGTAGTGGFGIRGNSVGYYSSYSQIVIAIFMVIFGINFNLFYLIFIGKFKQALKSEELWWYLGIIAVSVGIITIDIYNDANLAYATIGGSLKDSFFQVSAIITTTGFSTVDFTQWSSLSQTVLFILMFIGGCAGSTAGGMKVSRIAIIFKSLKREVKRLIHPNSVAHINFEGAPLDGGIVKGVARYFALLIILFTIFVLIISANGYDFTTNITAVATCINNVGPGLGQLVGPMGNFSIFSDFSTFMLSLAMLIGRLEIYPMLILFLPNAWSNKN